MDSPWMHSLTVAGATPVSLLALMEAADPAWNNTPRAVTYLQIQLDVNAGGVRLYVGNANVSPTNRGIELTAGQAGPNAMTVWGNPIFLGSVYLLTSSPLVGITVNVTTVQA